MKKPSERQVLAAKIRACEEEYERKHRKPSGGGYEVPSNKDRYKYLSKKFGMSPVDVSYYFTYSRTCSHKWSEGACFECPVPV